MGYTMRQTEAYLREAGCIERERMALLGAVVRAAAAEAVGGGDALRRLVAELTRS